MYIVKDNLDELLRCALEKLENGTKVGASKGKNRELSGVLLELTNPRARLSRTEAKGTVFSCLGEFLWYLSGSDKLDQIQYYLPNYYKFSDDGQTVNGAYGPRLFNFRGKHNQFESIKRLLTKRSSTRQAVIQIFDASDLEIATKDVPCTCTLQFFIRENHLHLVASMRSNDVFLGFPHDVFAFSMFQEILATQLELQLGTYKHFAGSLHLYEDNIDDAQRYLSEGWTENIPMPKMEQMGSKDYIFEITNIEKMVRSGNPVNLKYYDLDNYWSDIARLLQVYKLHIDRKPRKDIEKIKRQMNSNVYEPYINKYLLGME